MMGNLLSAAVECKLALVGCVILEGAGRTKTYSGERKREEEEKYV
jgi:hypothetical protein